MTPDIYPTALIRSRLDGLGVVSAAGLRRLDHRTRVTIGGVVTHRQRPATARGVTFLNLEDETGHGQRHRRGGGVAAAPAGRARVRRPADPRHARTHQGRRDQRDRRADRASLNLGPAHAIRRDFAERRRTRRRWMAVRCRRSRACSVSTTCSPRGRGTGRMSDLEFLHVTAKRILNHVPTELAGAGQLDDQRLSRLHPCVHILLRPPDPRIPRLRHRRRLRPQDRRQDQCGREAAGRARRSAMARRAGGDGHEHRSVPARRGEVPAHPRGARGAHRASRTRSRS